MERVVTFISVVKEVQKGRGKRRGRRRAGGQETRPNIKPTDEGTGILNSYYVWILFHFPLILIWHHQLTSPDARWSYEKTYIYTYIWN